MFSLPSNSLSERCSGRDQSNLINIRKSCHFACLCVCIFWLPKVKCEKMDCIEPYCLGDQNRSGKSAFADELTNVMEFLHGNVASVFWRIVHLFLFLFLLSFWFDCSLHSHHDFVINNNNSPKSHWRLPFVALILMPFGCYIRTVRCSFWPIL